MDRKENKTILSSDLLAGPKGKRPVSKEAHPVFGPKWASGLTSSHLRRALLIPSGLRGF